MVIRLTAANEGRAIVVIDESPRARTTATQLGQPFNFTVEDQVARAGGFNKWYKMVLILHFPFQPRNGPLRHADPEPAQRRKPLTFQQILPHVDFPQNGLRLRLEELMDQGLTTRHKTPRKGLGRPIYA